MSGGTGTQLPADAIELALAAATYRHAREWFKARIPVYYVGNKAYVSRSEAEAAHEAAQSQVSRVQRPDQ